MSDKAVVTCALTGVLTDPSQHPVPVTPAEMAREARAAFDAGAAIMHVHFRQQAPGKGHLPSWDPNVAAAIMQAIRDACPGVILNETTGTLGSEISGPLACLRAVKPEIAACNAGSLNYLKVRTDGSWAWPPHLFDNPVEKVGAYLDAKPGRSRSSNASMSASCAASACTLRTACSRACRDTILSWVLNRACRRTQTCSPSCVSLLWAARPGRSRLSAALRFGRCTAARPSSAVICALASRTRSTCRTAARWARMRG
jgi:hypothetical protein